MKVEMDRIEDLKKYAALIPARGGSKGLERKNILDLWGEPLISHTIRAAANVIGLEHVFVSTDDDEIKEVSLRYGAKVIERPEALALDDTPTLPVVQHFAANFGSSYQFCVLLQPTSPLRNSGHIKDAIRVFESTSQAMSLISCVELQKDVYKSVYEGDDGFMHGVAHDSAPFLRRQDLPRVYKTNGAIYIYSIPDIVERGFQLQNTVPYVMSSLDSLDIDTEFDLKRAEELGKNASNN